MILVAGAITGSAAFVVRQHPRSQNSLTIEAAIDDLDNCDYEARDRAAETLTQLRAEAVPYLAAAISRRDSLWRRYAARLPFIQPPRGNTAAIRERAAEQLAMIAPKDPGAIHALVAALADENAEVQRALRKCGASEQLIAAVHHRNPRVRRGAAEVLGDLGPRAMGSVPVLIEALRDKEESVRLVAARALGAIGDASAVASLVLELNDGSASVRATASESLGKIRAQESISALTERLSDPETEVRVKAAQSIWRIDRNADLVVPILMRALRDRRSGSDAKFVLGEIGPAAKEAIPALVQSLREERVGRPLRTPPSSALALGRIGVSAVTELIGVLTHDSAEIRTSAVIALGFIGKPAHDAVPHLMPLLADKQLEVRQAAALAIGAIDPENRDLVPALKQLARDDDIFLASAASAMLRDVDPAAAVELGLE